MKFNFKRIASVLTGAVMLSSTVALAAAANMYPAPFVTGSTADVAVVYGAAAANSDVLAAQKVATELGAKQLASATSTTSATPVDTSSEDVVALDKSSARMWAGRSVADTFASAVNEDDLPMLLAEGLYLDTDYTEFKYSQKIEVADLQLTQFVNRDYEEEEEDTPILGFEITDGMDIFNYTLDFQTTPVMNNTAMQGTDIEMMGKQYYVLSADDANNKLTLLDSANVYSINEGETKELTINGETYSITVTDVATTTARLSINGRTSSSLSQGATFKAAEGLYAGVKYISYKTKESSTSFVEVSLGSGKLELENGQLVEMNDDDVKGLTSYITKNGGSLDKVILTWRAEDDQFVTDKSSITMPGFNTFKLSTQGMVFPEEEKIIVTNDGDESISIDIPLKEGKVNLPIYWLNASNGTYGAVGKSLTHLTATSSGATIYIDEDTDDYFVASYKNGEEAESYIFEVGSISDNDGINETTITEKTTGKVWNDVSEGDDLQIGNVELTIGKIMDSNNTVGISRGNSDVSFNKLYSKEGLEVTLPVGLLTGATQTLTFTEEDKDGNIGAGGSFTMTLGVYQDNNGDNLTSVTTINSMNVTTEIRNTEVYQNIEYSALATIVNHDRDPNQRTAEIVYHGGESYAQLILSAPSAVVGGPGEVGNILKVSDSEVATVEGKNLIVVGGSCVNTVAQTLLGSTSKLCGEAFTANTGIGMGEFLVNTYSNPYTTGKVATLVAGYEAADTEAAVNALGTKEIPTDVGSTYKGSTTLVVSDSE